jgi:hypothetical protein
MPGISKNIRTAGRGGAQSKELLAADSPRRLAARAARPGTPGLIAPGPGLCLPRLREHHWQFSRNAVFTDGAQFAANLLRAGVAAPEDWNETRNIGAFLQRTIERFVGARAARIDYAFDIGFCLGTTASSWREPEEINPHRILLTFRVAHTVGWVNLTPALDLLKAEHELLPTLFYHWLNDSLSRWFRIFNVQEARWRWESWNEMRNEDEAERKEECEREGVPYEPTEMLDQPDLPGCIGMMPKGKLPNIAKLTRSTETARLMEAAERLNQISHRACCPKFHAEDREDLFPDSDPPVPVAALAFGEHDVITEFLNMELETAGQVEVEPWPILKMDGADPRSIRKAFRCACVALDTLEAASRTLSLVPGFEAMTKHNLYGA